MSKQDFIEELNKEDAPYKKFSKTLEPLTDELVNDFEKLDKPRMEVDELAVRNDLISHPEHYRPGVYEAINVIRAWELNFAMGNALKYICRAGRKDPETEIEDLRKAIFYLQSQIVSLESHK